MVHQNYACGIWEECLKHLRKKRFQAPISSLEASIYLQIIDMLQIIFLPCLLKEALKAPPRPLLNDRMNGWMCGK